MEASANTLRLRHALDLAARVAEKNGTLPILAAVILEADADTSTLTVSAYNLEVGCRLRVPADVDIPGRVAVHAKRLRDLLKTLVIADVQLVLDGSSLVLTCDGPVRVELLTLDDSEMPPLPKEEPEFHAIAGEVLRDALKRVAYAASDDEDRYNLMSAHVSIADGRLVSEATDGHRLVRVTAPVPGVPDHELLVPRKAIDVLAEVAGRDEFAQLGATGGTVHVRDGGGSVEVFARMVDGQFPRADQIIDPLVAAESTRVVVSSEALLDDLKTIRSVVDDTHGVRLVTGPVGLRLSGQDANHGRVEVEIRLPELPPRIVEVGLNPKYLVEAVSAAKAEQVVIAITDELEPVLVTPHGVREGASSYQAVIMPMRLTSTTSHKEDSADATDAPNEEVSA